MRVKLKVIKGSRSGKVMPIQGNQLVIGRGEGCDLQPHTDLISRHHCVIIVTDSRVMIRDLGSKNGTFVNDERVEEEQGLMAGDRLRIGPLEFEVLIDSQTEVKRPQVQNVAEVVQRTAEESVSEFDVSTWLEEVDQAEREQRQADPGTRQFRLNDTESLSTRETVATTGDTAVDANGKEGDTKKETEDPKNKKQNKNKKNVTPRGSGTATPRHCSIPQIFLRRRCKIAGAGFFEQRSVGSRC